MKFTLKEGEKFKLSYIPRVSLQDNKIYKI